MKFEEVVDDLRVGRKVRRKAWDSAFLCVNYDSHGASIAISIDSLLADDWEVMRETKKLNYMEAVQHAKGGLNPYRCILGNSGNDKMYMKVDNLGIVYVGRSTMAFLDDVTSEWFVEL